MPAGARARRAAELAPGKRRQRRGPSGGDAGKAITWAAGGARAAPLAPQGAGGVGSAAACAARSGKRAGGGHAPLRPAQVVRAGREARPHWPLTALGGRHWCVSREAGGGRCFRRGRRERRAAPERGAGPAAAGGSGARERERVSPPADPWRRAGSAAPSGPGPGWPAGRAAAPWGRLCARRGLGSARCRGVPPSPRLGSGGSGEESALPEIPAAGWGQVGVLGLRGTVLKPCQSPLKLGLPRALTPLAVAAAAGAGPVPCPAP